MRCRQAQTAQDGAVTTKRHDHVAPRREPVLGAAENAVGEPALAVQAGQRHTVLDSPGPDLPQSMVQLALGSEHDPERPDGARVVAAVGHHR
jgi:hypothetical protein